MSSCTNRKRLRRENFNNKIKLTKPPLFSNNFFPLKAKSFVFKQTNKKAEQGYLLLNDSVIKQTSHFPPLFFCLVFVCEGSRKPKINQTNPFGSGRNRCLNRGYRREGTLPHAVCQAHQEKLSSKIHGHPKFQCFGNIDTHRLKAEPVVLAIVYRSRMIQLGQHTALQLR